MFWHLVIKTNVIGVIVLYFVTVSYCQGVEMDIDFIAAGMENTSHIITDLSVKYRVEGDIGHKPESGSQKFWFKGTWVKKGFKEYLEQEQTLEPGITNFAIYAYDGEKTTGWALDPAHPDDPGTGRIIKGKLHPAFEANFAPARLAFEVDGTEVSWVQALRNGTCQIIGKEVIGGYLCHVLEGKITPEDFRHYKVWIDTERGFMPLKIEINIKGGDEIVAIYDSVVLQKYLENIWLPIEAAHHGRTPGYVEKMTTQEIKINQGISDDFFVLKWKNGTGVWDEIIGTPFRIGEEPNL